ncbi:hypothetical protein AGMMS50239_10050 [Bacteroidia bacterium]|nr:hypothetical protein AGMMS50239_10050 [Bacteroidia bacterium]
MKDLNKLIQVAKNIITKNKTALIAATILSLFFIFKAGHALGEFIYYLGQS